MSTNGNKNLPDIGQQAANTQARTFVALVLDILEAAEKRNEDSVIAAPPTLTNSHDGNRANREIHRNY
jgi:hypothetical protein